MAFNVASVTGSLSPMIRSWIFWGIFLVVCVGVGIGGLYFRKKRKFKYGALILNDLGNGKIGVEKQKAGWFKSNKIFFRLLDVSGERRLEVNDGRIVQQGSTVDFHEINFKRGLILMAKPSDPKILVPLKRLNVVNKELLAKIAPADYRDASSKIIAEAQRETLDKWTQIATMITFGILGIILFISLVMVIQYSKGALSEANMILQQALEMKAQIAQSIVATPSAVAP